MSDHSNMMLSLTIIMGCLLLAAYGKQKDHFTEELFIKPLSRGRIYSHFQFTTKWNSSIHDTKTFQHYSLFPKTLGEVLSKYNVQELHLSQTQGLWQYDQWGYPIHDSPPGAELWVWFKPSVKDVDKSWAALVNAVSGLFCSSLNFLDRQVTVAPRWSFKPHGLAPQGYSMFPHYVRYGTLPKEMVCTENLTPWKKLLPCDSKMGLSTLFNPYHFHAGDYHSLGLHVRPICQDSGCMQDAIELSQSLSVVTDASINSNSGLPNWSLKSLFGNHLVSACPIASKSTIMIETTDNKNGSLYTLTPAPSSTKSVWRGSEEHNYALYDVSSFTGAGRVLNVAGTYNYLPVRGDFRPPIFTHRYITGYGLEDGGVTCLIHNTMPTNQSILYMDVLPWFTRVFFKSLKVENKDAKLPFRVHYTPAKDRIRPHHLELSFTLWPHSVTKITFSFTRAFLKWTEYPPDANHGFYISSAVVTAMLPLSVQYTAPPQGSSQLVTLLSEANATEFPVRLHTESLLVSLPTPDFSMPYNVICLACTVVAIAFGSIHNLTTKRFVAIDPEKKKGLLFKLKSFFKNSRKISDKETKISKDEDDKNVNDPSQTSTKGPVEDKEKTITS